MDIGHKLKVLRTQYGLTQEELADRCELSKGFISQLENNLTSPSIATLTDILQVLGTDLKTFFSDNPTRKVVFKSDDIFVKEEEDQTIHWLITDAQKYDMEPILVELKLKGKTYEYKPHEGEMFGYVISGTVALHIGETKHIVDKGESFYFTRPKNIHYIENVGKTEAKFVWVSTPPIF